jgi:pimeloyl-ACP methyl ester carboxylesterase
MMGSSIVHELGDPAGFAVVVHNGTPCSRLMPEWWDAPARQRGLRIIGVDRPGYGNAAAEPDRSVGSVVDATAALMEELGVDRFAVIGVSGGGPYALACGAFLPDRVVAVVSGAGSSGFDEAVDGAAWEDEELELTREQALRPTTEGRQALARFYDPEIENLRSADVEGFMTAFGDDPAAATPEQRATSAYVLAAIQEGIRPGRDGWLDDGLAMLRPWASRRPTSASRWRCGTARTTPWSRSSTAADWWRRSRTRSRSWSTGWGTGASAAARRCRCSTGS